jgi:hypothetical protein
MGPRLRGDDSELLVRNYLRNNFIQFVGPIKRHPSYLQSRAKTAQLKYQRSMQCDS